MKSQFYILLSLLLLVITPSCKKALPDDKREPILEVEGRFLYHDDLQQVIPPNIKAEDSANIAKSFIRKWVTDVLMYENAKRNVVNQAEIDDLVENYRKSLTIHQYQQKMISERLPNEPSEADLQAFYKSYSSQLELKEDIIQGMLLIVPSNAPKLDQVRAWVQSGSPSSLESIEKYSIRNAISYDYFVDKWISFTEILKKIPLQIQNSSEYVSTHRFMEANDSTNRYFLRITNHRVSGQVEPYEMAKNKISAILLNKLKADFMTQFEEELYNDAVKNEDVTFFNEK